MLRYSGWGNFTVESLGQAVDHFGPLATAKDIWWARSKDKVPVKVNNKSIRWCSEKASAFSRHTKNVRARLLNQLLRMAGMDNRDIETAPFINTNAESNGLGSDGQDGRVVTDENNTACWRYSCFDNTNNIGD